MSTFYSLWSKNNKFLYINTDIWAIILMFSCKMAIMGTQPCVAPNGTFNDSFQVFQVTICPIKVSLQLTSKPQFCEMQLNY